MTYREPPEGWYTFGTHVGYPGPIELSSELDEDGMPFWERPIGIPENNTLWAHAENEGPKIF